MTWIVYEGDAPIVTLWCLDCDGPSTLVEEGIETSAWPEPERDYWVRRLDCGHEESHAR